MKEDRNREIEQLYSQLLKFKKSSLYSFRKANNYKPVIGEGSPYSPVLFIGEAPGKNEALQGRPFCGASGRVLDELLKSIGVDRKSVFISNIVNDRPPENRDPTPEEISLYSPFLNKLLDIIQPKVIATLGRFSMMYIMEKYGYSQQIQPISKIHGKIFNAKTHYGAIKIVPLFHPASALYQGSKKKIQFDDFKILSKLLTF